LKTGKLTSALKASRAIVEIPKPASIIASRLSGG